MNKQIFSSESNVSVNKASKDNKKTSASNLSIESNDGVAQSSICLTNQSIKRHSKRLKKIALDSFDKELSLNQSYELFARILGLDSYGRLKQVLNEKGSVEVNKSIVCLKKANSRAA